MGAGVPHFPVSGEQGIVLALVRINVAAGPADATVKLVLQSCRRWSLARRLVATCYGAPRQREKGRECEQRVIPDTMSAEACQPRTLHPKSSNLQNGQLGPKMASTLGKFSAIYDTHSALQVIVSPPRLPKRTSAGWASKRGVSGRDEGHVHGGGKAG